VADIVVEALSDYGDLWSWIATKVTSQKAK